MVYQYTGHYQYNSSSVTNNAPDKTGVYYCGHLNSEGSLIPDYIGRAMGEGVTIQSRLADHLREDYWPDATHFGYQICTTKSETEAHEAEEIAKYKPKYNTQGV